MEHTDAGLASMNGEQSQPPVPLAINDSTTDFVIECQGEVFNVHKSVLVEHSGYFRNCLRFSCGKEMEEGKTVLDEEDPVLLGVMLTFMYTGEYVIPDGRGEDDSSAGADSIEVDLVKCQSMNETNVSGDVDANLHKQDTDPHQSGSDHPCSCTCHTSPNHNAKVLTTSQEILVRRGEHREFDNTIETKFSWIRDGVWELQTHRQWTCCHGFAHGIGTSRSVDCYLPCMCKAHEQALAPEDMSVHAFMYPTADYFDVPALKDLALEKFKATAHVHCRTEAFAQTIRDVFSSAMPADATTPCTVMIDILVQVPALWTYAPVKRVLEDMGAVTLAVLNRKDVVQQEKEKQGLIYGWQLEQLELGRGVLEVMQPKFPPSTRQCWPRNSGNRNYMGCGY